MYKSRFFGDVRKNFEFYQKSHSFPTLKLIFKEFENLSVEKRRFRLRWDSSPGLSIAFCFSLYFYMGIVGNCGCKE